MILKNQIDRIKADNSPSGVARRLGHDLNESGDEHVMLCPFHADENPSMHVYPDHYYCFGCKWHGDVIEFVQTLRNLSFSEACEFLGGKATDGPVDETAIKAHRESVRAADAEHSQTRRKARAKWPKFRLGKDDDFRQLAESRGLSYEACYHAGRHLVFCKWKGVPSWGILDAPESPKFVQVRRQDGKPFTRLGKPIKALTLPGSVMCPIGLVESPRPVVVVEGGPDYLAAWEELIFNGLQEQYDVVAMLGTSSRFGESAELLRNRDVWIVPHQDEDPMKGKAAADRWAAEASESGARTIRIINLTSKDLNEMVVAEK